MSNFKTYKYHECTVKAVQMAPSTQNEIVKSLGSAAAEGLLAKLLLSYNATTRTYDCVFRYKTDSTEQKIVNTDFLVLYTSGQYGAASAADFLRDYTEV